VSDFLRNKRHVDEIDRLLREGEPERRKRQAARNKALDRLLMAILAALVVIALTRLSVWIAQLF
jgi:hypothetical protein